MSNQNIQGSESISRNLSVGNDVDVKGNVIVGHDIVVKGWLDAPNIKNADVKENVSVGNDVSVKGNVTVKKSLTVGDDVYAEKNLRVKGWLDAPNIKNADVKENVTVGKNLTVKGWVDAPNIKGALKGLYKTESALKEAYPTPQPGWYALVGDTLPASVWRADVVYGKCYWFATGETGGEFAIYPAQLEETTAKNSEAVKDLQERIEIIESPFIYKDTYVYSYEPENTRSGDGFVCTPYICVEKGLEVKFEAYEFSDVCAPVLFFDSSFKNIGKKTTGSSGVKQITLKSSDIPTGTTYFRANALKGNTKWETINPKRLHSVSPEEGNVQREVQTVVSSQLGSVSDMLEVALDVTEVSPVSNRYFNLRGVKKGDKLTTFVAETTSEEGLQAATVSFAKNLPRVLTLSSKGTDMVRNYVALDDNLIVLAISDNGDYQWQGRSVSLPENTRHLLVQSYSEPLKATVVSPRTEESDFNRHEELVWEDKCADCGNKAVGSYLTMDEIRHQSGAPNAICCLAEYKDGYEVTVTINTGTPNVPGIVYLDEYNKILGWELPLRTALSMKRITPPAKTSKILFQTYDKNEFPAEADINYNLLSALEKIVNGNGTSSTVSRERWLVIGDSIMEIPDESGLRVPDYLSRIGGVEVTNCAVGGSRLTLRGTPSLSASMSLDTAYAAYDAPSIVDALVSGDFSLQRAATQRLKSEGDDNSFPLSEMERADLGTTDVVLIHAGTNDYASGVDANSDSGSKKESIYGAMAYISKILLESYPHLRILVDLPLPRMLNPADVSTFSDIYKRSGAVSTLGEIAEAIGKAARREHFKTIDLYWELGWNCHNYASKCIGTDGSHPKRGYREIAKLILDS